MKHCTKPTYMSDDFCEECGGKLTDSAELRTMEECVPDCLIGVKKYYPNAEIGTGIVESVFFYERKFKNKKSNLTYSYCWLTLSLSNGEKVQYNIDAENSLGSNLKEGDVITLFRPSSIVLTHKHIFKKYVLNDEYIEYVIKHNKKGSQTAVEGDYYEPEEKEKPEITAYAMLLIPCVLFYFLNLSITAIMTISIILTLIVLAIEWSSISRAYSERETEFKAIKDAFDAIKVISRKQLGYENLHREKHEADVICVHCQQRVSNEASYCYKCGGSQQQTLKKATKDSTCKVDLHRNELTSEELTSEELTSEELTSEELSIKEIEDQIKADYALKYEVPFEYANFLCANYSGTINIEGVIGKVIDKDVAANVSDRTTTTTKTTTSTTDYYTQKGDYVRTDRHVDTSESKHRQRNSNLTGEILLSTEHGGIYLTVPSRQISSIDVGDWLFYGDWEIITNNGKFKQHSRIYFDNLTKDIAYSTADIDWERYSRRDSSMSQLYHLLAFIASLTIWGIDNGTRVNLYAWPEAVNDLIGAPLNSFFMVFYPSMLYMVFSIYGLFELQKRRKKNAKEIDNSLTKLSNLKSKVVKNLTVLRGKFNMLN